MTLVTIDLGDVAGGHDPDDHVIIRAEAFRESPGGGVTSTAEVKIPLVDGVGQAEVEPGPVVVSFRCRAVADTREKRGVVPDEGPVGIEDVISSSLTWTPPVADRIVETIREQTDDLRWFKRHLTVDDTLEDLGSGLYLAPTVEVADAVGAPVSAHGTVAIVRWGTQEAGAGLAVFTSREVPAREWSGRWTPAGTWQGWQRMHAPYVSPTHLTPADSIDSLQSGHAYVVSTVDTAAALGLPAEAHGVLSVVRWGVGNAGAGLAIFQTREVPSQMFTGTWSPEGNWHGWQPFGGGIEESFYKGNLTQSSDLDTLTTGLYSVETADTASALGLPVEQHGVLSVTRWNGSSAGIAIFDTRENSSRRFIHTWRPDGTAQGWQESQQQTTTRPPVSDRVEWLTLFQDGHGWTTPNANSATPEADTEDYLAGTQSLKMAPAAGQDDILLSPPVTLDLTGKALVVWAKYDEGEIFDGRVTGLVVKAYDATGAYRRWRMIQPSAPAAHYKHGEWAQVRFVQELSLDGAADWSKITRLEIGTGESRNVDPRTWHIQGVGLIEQDKRWPKGVISITFDDGEKENLRAAREILTPRGIKATAYVMREHTIDPERPWYLDPDDVVELYEKHGWTIGSHKLDRHLESSPEQLRTEWDADVAWFHEMGIPPAKHLAWTQGAYDETRVRVAREYFETARSISQGVEPLPLGDRYRIRAVTSVSDSGHNLALDLAQTKIWIDRAVRSGGWLSLVFHALTDTPTSQHEASFEFLADVADYILASGCEIATYDEMLPYLGYTGTTPTVAPPARSSRHLAYTGTGTPLLSDFPDAQIGDYIVRKTDGQEWRVDE